MTATQTTPDLVLDSAPIDRVRYEIPHPDPAVFRITIDRASVSTVIPHVNNVEYLRWFDRAAELHSDAVGYTRQRMLNDGVMWFVARHELDYCAESWPNDKLRLATWVRDVRRIKSWRDYVIVREKDETVIARAATLWVLVDLETRRPRRVPTAMIDALQPLFGNESGA